MSIATSWDAPSEIELSPEPRGIWSNPPTLIKWLFVADLAVAALAVISHGVGKVLGIGKIDMFRLGQENNLPTWYSSSQLLLVALVLLLFARQRIERLGRFDWRLMLPSAFFFLLSLDETASMHEGMGDALEGVLASLGGGTGMRVGAWTLVAAPVFLVGLFIVARLTRAFWAHTPRVKWKFIIGFAICFVSAVGGELIMSAVPADSLAEKVETLFEETGEMVGITILLWAALDLLASEDHPLISRRRAVRPAVEEEPVEV